LRRPGAAGWERTDDGAIYPWKEPIRRVLELYEAATPGTHVEEKRAGLVWHYRQADPEFGEEKAKELAMELSAVAANEPVTVRRGRKIVEVTSAGADKGAAVARVLAGRAYDLVLIAGDDVTDESMFRLDLPAESTITAKVGEGDTAARHRVSGPAELRRVFSPT
jgi:trehalose 6-phosphate synthase/phosphatase